MNAKYAPLALALAACAACSSADDDAPLAQGASLSSTPTLLVSPNANGEAATYTKNGGFDFGNPFFKSLGQNGRVCASCHDKDNGWTITPAFVQARFDATNGTDPVFSTVDGSNSPRADVSTVAARRKAYSMLLTKGLIRIGLPIPAGADFELAAVDDPYGYASAQELSLFRRPLPTTNLTFLSTVMWDGRFGTSGPFIPQQLTDQANAATQGHAQALIPLTDTQRNQIFGFEVGLFTAQITSSTLGPLYAAGGRGGPQFLSSEPYYTGINDPLGGNPTKKAFDPVAMKLYDAWATGTPEQRAVAHGQQLFNTKPISIRGVRGLNDTASAPVIAGTCTTCHDSPDVGHHSVALPLDIGLTDASRRTPDMPLYTLRNTTTGEVLQTTDPGRGLVTGKWKDLARFKGPILRGLSARPPYFHNGSAASLDAVVDFYDTRFSIGFTAQEKADLVTFLKVL